MLRPFLLYIDFVYATEKEIGETQRKSERERERESDKRKERMKEWMKEREGGKGRNRNMVFLMVRV